MGSPPWIGLNREPEDGSDSRVVRPSPRVERGAPEGSREDTEKVEFTFRTHWKVLIPQAFKLLFTLVLVTAVFAFVPQHLLDGKLDLYLALAIGVIGLSWAGYPVLQWWSTIYQITNFKITYRTGILSRTGKSIMLTRIADVDYHQSLVDRLFGCGTLHIANAATTTEADGSVAGGLSLHDIPRVQQVRDRINELALARQNRLGPAEHRPGEEIW